MEELKKISVAAYDDLKISQSCLWSRAFFTEYLSFDAFENNLGEPFNAAIRIARTKPVVEMLEDIRRKHCGNCGQTRHNKMYCKKYPFSKPPKNQPGGHTRNRRKWFASASQPEHDIPSLSSGLPKRGPGRPRKKLSEGVYIISFCSII
ncbi:hypothetical protein IGI04_019529, partial [Brassica rapa subsp. trilocularis]